MKLQYNSILVSTDLTVYMLSCTCVKYDLFSDILSNSALNWTPNNNKLHEKCNLGFLFHYSKNVTKAQLEMNLPNMYCDETAFMDYTLRKL